MNKKKIFIFSVITIAVVTIGYFAYKKIRTLSGNPDKDNRQINIFRTDK